MFMNFPLWMCYKGPLRPLRTIMRTKKSPDKLTAPAAFLSFLAGRVRIRVASVRTLRTFLGLFSLGLVSLGVVWLSRHIFSPIKVRVGFMPCKQLVWHFVPVKF